MLNNGGGAPTLDAAHTKNITAVTRVLAGVYCLQAASGISSASVPALVSVDWSDATTNPAAHSHPGFNCPAGQFEFITRDNSAATAGAYSNNISFYVMIP